MKLNWKLFVSKRTDLCEHLAEKTSVEVISSLFEIH